MERKKNNVEVPAVRLFMCAHIVFLFFPSAFLLSFFPFDFSATKWFVEHMSCLLYAIA